LTTSLTPLFTIGTPYPGASMVTLYHHTWEQHILPHRPELAGNEVWLRTTLSEPSIICAGTTNPAHVAFLNLSIVSPGGQSPLAVFVNPANKMVVSAGYRRDFRNLEQHRVLWVPPQSSL
jgi:hypothetical protein